MRRSLIETCAPRLCLGRAHRNAASHIQTRAIWHGIMETCMSTITFSAARRRFERAHDQHRTISKMSKAERQGMGDAPFALMEGNTIRDTGDTKVVERW